MKSTCISGRSARGCTVLVLRRRSRRKRINAGRDGSREHTRAWILRASIPTWAEKIDGLARSFGHVKSRVPLQSRDTFAILGSALRRGSLPEWSTHLRASRDVQVESWTDNYLAIRDDALMDQSAEREGMPRVSLSPLAVSRLEG
jgi:hypothetical protein